MSAKSDDHFLQKVYEETLSVLKSAINSGASNVPLSVSALDAYIDLLHGGAYRPDAKLGGNNVLPSFLSKQGSQGNSNFDSGNEKTSPYYVGCTWLDLQQDAFTFAIPFGGGTINVPQIGTHDAQDVLSNANVPTLFPKLLSDQFYSRWVLWRAQILTTLLLTSTITGLGTGLKTFVSAVEPIPGLIGANSTSTTDASDNQ